jgi:hypothetical protein
MEQAVLYSLDLSGLFSWPVWHPLLVVVYSTKTDANTPSKSEQAHAQFNYNSHIEAHIFNYIIMFMHYIIHIKFTCSHKLNIYNIYSKSYTKTHSKLALALLRLLAGLLFPPVLLLPFSNDIMSQFSPAEVLSRQKPICFLTFQSKNECTHLVIILNN